MKEIKEIKVGTIKIEVTTHNKREETLVRIINQCIDRAIEYMMNDTFGERTHRIVNSNIKEINAYISALYMMDLTKEFEALSDIDFEEEIIKRKEA